MSSIISSVNPQRYFGVVFDESILRANMQRINGASMETLRQCKDARWAIVPYHLHGPNGQRGYYGRWIDWVISKGHIFGGLTPWFPEVWLGESIIKRDGKSLSLVCVDVDLRVDGASEAFQTLTKERGVLNTVWDDREGGGPHYYCLLPVEFFDGYNAKMSLQLAPGVEFFSRSHLVSLPPSTGHDNTQARRWIVPPSKDSANVAVLPEAWQNRIKKLLNKVCKVTPSKPRPKREMANITERATKYISKMDSAVSGQHGHNKLFRAACVLIQGFGLSFNEAYPILETYNERCEPPFSERDLLHKLRDADNGQDSHGKPRGYLRDAERNGSFSPSRNGRTKKGVSLPPPKPQAKANGEASEEGQQEPIDDEKVPNDERWCVRVEPDGEHKANDLVTLALANAKLAPNLYKRGTMLVRVIRSLGDDFRQEGTPIIAGLSKATLRDAISRTCYFVKETVNGDKLLHVPEWLTPAVQDRGEWPKVRYLTGILESPTLRPDGSILDKPGWDEATGLFYLPNAHYPPIPENPTKEQVDAAVDRLLYVVEDFPFAPNNPNVHKVAWLSALLTALARHCVNGPCPTFVFDANNAGTGKGLLVDAISLIGTGREIGPRAFPKKDEELDKQITSIAIAGDRLVLWDNIPSGLLFGGDSLDAALTKTTWNGRILGTSKETGQLPLRTVWFATGNNVQYKGDTQRRVVLCRMETATDEPDKRSDFKEPHLKRYILEHRGELVCAALTILRGFYVAGKPTGKLTSFGSFESWSDVIRSAVVFATGYDPCSNRSEIRENDQGLNNLTSLLEGLAEMQLAIGSNIEGLTVAEMLGQLKNQEDTFPTLYAALMQWSRDDRLPGSGRIGTKFSSLRGTVIDGKKLANGRAMAKGGAQRWRVVNADGTPLER